MKRTVVLLVLLAMLAGCAPGTVTKSPPVDTENTTIDHFINRHYDCKAKVVCWVWTTGYQNGGISCLPFNQTMIDYGKECKR